jgi:hypothetical protein
LFNSGCSFVATVISPVVRFKAPSDVVNELVVVMVLCEQLLVQERGLDKWEDALLAKEHGVVEAERALDRVRVECDALHD